MQTRVVDLFSGLRLPPDLRIVTCCGCKRILQAPGQPRILPGTYVRILGRPYCPDCSGPPTFWPDESYCRTEGQKHGFSKTRS